MKEIQDIVLIGAGNVAWHLGKALKSKGLNILQVISPNTASALASELSCEAITDTSLANPNADLYLICVTDTQVESAAKTLTKNNGIVAHTSGSMPINALDTHESFGSFYPLQTISKEKEIDFSSVPFFVEANNKNTSEALQSLAEKLSTNVQEINSKQRKTLHVAAVFACNFTNHCYSIAHNLLAENGLNFDALKPLIKETAEKAILNNPNTMQTGPAIRKDEKTLQEHNDFLKEHPTLQKIYTLLSQDIINNSKNS